MSEATVYFPAAASDSVSNILVLSRANGSVVMRTEAGRVGFVVALLLVPVAAAKAQQLQTMGGIQVQPGRDRPPVVRVGTGVLKGRVVDGATGGAVPRARVMLQGAAFGRPPVTTDGSGAFAFTNLPAGPVTVMVEKSTFLQGRYPDAGRTFRSASRGLVLADGQVLDDVTIRIFHGCAISGRVLDANGDPVEFAQISAIRVPGSGRGGRLDQRGGSQSNDLGEFRVARLEPGTYVLQVNPRRMQIDQIRSDGMPGAPAPPTPQPLPTYYPSAVALEQAQPITLERGQSVSDIDVVLAEGLPAVIAGTVTGPDGQPVIANTYLNARGVAREGMGGFDGSGASVRSDGTFRMTVPPGEWIIEARHHPPEANGRPDSELFGTVRISVAGGAEETVSIAVGRGATVTGRVVFEGSSPPPPSPTGPAHVPLYSPDGACRSGQAAVAADWTFRLTGAFGRCSPPPMAIFGRWMVKAVMYNGDNLLDAPYTFQPGQQLRNVQVIVTDKRTEIGFRVADENGQSTREYVALLYPVDKTQWSQAVRTLVGPPVASVPPASRAPVVNGSARGPGVIPPVRRDFMSGIRPGEYYAVAVDDMEMEDSRDPVVLERLASSGVRVTVSEGANQEIPLRRVKMADVIRK